MPRACSICTHEAQAQIDQALVGGAPNRRVAARFRLSESSVRRHRATHLPDSMLKAQEIEEVANADAIVASIRDLHERTLRVLRTAESSGDLVLALRAIREARANVELLAKISGDLQDRTEVNVYASTQWIELQGRVVAALAPHPQAQIAVAEALAGSDPP